ncbi:hypothetical protein CIT292_10645 [Citrobacter youngae ATCC 29220]|uniref:Uncharacterized protein n=1 Tax=Citrobacter youngae ATCC 29220 TaxID=500640 RepID=D4BK29_9ENTR|nr:hypothetical protein CIT292_10645 [Citrobacter youngae ATCC 29220]
MPQSQYNDLLPQSVGRIRRSRRHPTLKCLMATLARLIRPTTETNEYQNDESEPGK